MDKSINQSKVARWWTEPAGGREVLTLAWPLMLSTGLVSINMFFDRMFLYQDSDHSAAAAMEGGTLFWVLTCAPVGLLSYTSTFVAQYFGAGRLDRAFRVTGQGLLLALLIFPLFALIAFQSSALFRFFGHSESLVIDEANYINWLIPGAFAMFITSVLNGFLSGIGRVRIMLISDIVSTILNIVLDAVLIFGMLGFPRLGIIGAAVATTISLLAKCIILLIVVARMRQRFLHQQSITPDAHPPCEKLSRGWFDWSLLRRFVYFGWPAGIQLLTESISFLIIMLLVGQLGEANMSATTLALGVNVLAFIPMTGLGLAVGVLVGQRLTSGRPDLAQRSVQTGISIAVIYSIFFVILYGGFSDLVLSVYGIGIEPERFDDMRERVRPLLLYIALYCVFDALQIVYVAAIKGAGDTAFVLIASVAIGFTIIGGGLGLSQFYEGDLFYWWKVITVWVFAMAIVFGGRYFQGRWKKMRVIEPNVAAV